MPLDHTFEVVDHDERFHPLILQCRDGSVAQSKPTDHHIEMLPFQDGKPELGQLRLRLVEEAGHKEVFAQLYFIDVAIPELGHAPPA